MVVVVVVVIEVVVVTVVSGTVVVRLSETNITKFLELIFDLSYRMFQERDRPRMPAMQATSRWGYGPGRGTGPPEKPSCAGAPSWP